MKFEKSYKSKLAEAERMCHEAEEAEKAYNKVKAEIDESEDAEAKTAKKETEEAEETEKAKNASPKKLTIAELKAKNVKLAAKPEIRMTMKKFNGKTFSQLRSELKNNPDAFENLENKLSNFEKRMDKFEEYLVDIKNSLSNSNNGQLKTFITIGTTIIGVLIAGIITLLATHFK